MAAAESQPRLRGALDLVDQSVIERPSVSWSARALRPDDLSVIAGLAIASAMRGRTDEAHRMLERLTAESARRYISPVIPAYAHAALGERDSTFALLERAYAAKDPLLAPIQTLETQLGLRVPSGPAAAVRADPRFADLVRRMGFPRRDAAGGPSTPASAAPKGGR